MFNQHVSLARCSLQYKYIEKWREVCETNLPGGEDNSGELRAVAPLGQEGEGEGLDEDGRDEAVPLPLRNSGSGLHVRGPVHQLGSLELCRREAEWFVPVIYISYRCWHTGWHIVLF